MGLPEQYAGAAQNTDPGQVGYKFTISSTLAGQDTDTLPAVNSHHPIACFEIYCPACGNKNIVASNASPNLGSQRKLPCYISCVKCGSASNSLINHNQPIVKVLKNRPDVANAISKVTKQADKDINHLLISMTDEVIPEAAPEAATATITTAIPEPLHVLDQERSL